jgi:hypothetical protein
MKTKFLILVYFFISTLFSFGQNKWSVNYGLQSNTSFRNAEISRNFYFDCGLGLPPARDFQLDGTIKTKSYALNLEKRVNTNIAFSFGIGYNQMGYAATFPTFPGGRRASSGKVNYLYEFVDIPVKAIFYLGEGLSPYFTIAASGNYLVNATANEVKWQDISNLQRINLTYEFGFGLKYEYAKSLIKIGVFDANQVFNLKESYYGDIYLKNRGIAASVGMKL